MKFGKKLQETENKAQVPQAHHLANVLDFLKEPGLEAGLQDGAELLCVCVYGQQKSGRGNTATFVHIVNDSLFQLPCSSHRS